ncbi:MAG TPA: WYL domain-containing protein [Agriterribacter sp.]|nr:WYL domain-containing protein [Agriterribacter sp.]
MLDKLVEEYSIQITRRTLERDFRLLDTYFGIQVLYNRKSNSYTISEEDDEQVASFLQFTGRIYLGDLLKEGLENFAELRKSVRLEEDADFEGLALIAPLLIAIKNQLSVRFMHENYSKQTHTKYHITPLQLREYRRRWYVVGVPEGEDRIKTFGLARMSKLQSQTISKIDASQFEQQLKKFDNIIGLNYDAHERKELIELAVTARQYRYMHSLPLHASQGEGERLPDGRFKLSLLLIPNYELKMELLSMGDQIEVLSPKTLRDDIRNTLHQTLKQYNHER